MAWLGRTPFATIFRFALRPNNCKTTILQSIHCRSWFPACAKIKEKESQQRGEYQSVETQYKKNWLSGFGNLAVLRWPSNERSDPLSFGGFVTTVPKWVLDYTLFCLSFLTQKSVGHFLWHLILSICYSLSVHTFTCNNIVISASMSTHFLPLSLNLFVTVCILYLFKHFFSQSLSALLCSDSKVLHCISQLERLQLIGTRGARCTVHVLLLKWWVLTYNLEEFHVFPVVRFMTFYMNLDRQDFQFFQMEDEVWMLESVGICFTC